MQVSEYQLAKDAVQLDGDVNGSNIGRLTVLPSSFLGGPRENQQYLQDCLTYVREGGKPDLFVTFTTNPEWSEIKSGLINGEGQEIYDKGLMECRVFNQRVIRLYDLIKKGDIFGKVRFDMACTEFQKRGLPHLHLLLWMHDRIRADQIDDVARAEIPDPELDPDLHRIVVRNMIHGPCGLINPRSPCMVNGQCSKGYPKPYLAETQHSSEGYPLYRRRKPGDGGFTIEKKVGDEVKINYFNLIHEND